MFWAGAGPAILHSNPDGRGDSDTDFGVNLFMGIGFKTSGHDYSLCSAESNPSDDSQFVLAFGVRF